MRTKYRIAFQGFDNHVYTWEVNVHYSEYDKTYSASDLGDNLDNDSDMTLGCGKDSRNPRQAVISLLAGRILLTMEKY